MTFLIILLPLVVTATAFGRHIIGMKLFGPYICIIMVYAAIALGLIPGVGITIAVYLISSLMRYLSRKLRMHYIPRIALLTTILAVVALIFSTETSIFGSLAFAKELSLVLLLGLSDSYLTAEIQKGYMEAGKMFLQTLILVIILLLFASWAGFRDILSTYPFLVLALCLVANIYIGRWKGLRFNEIYRFRSVIAQKAKEL